MISAILHDGFTCTLEQVDISAIAQDAICIFPASSGEPRAHLNVWDELKKTRPHQWVEVVDQHERHALLRTAAGESKVVLSDQGNMGQLFTTDSAYIDISGLGHHIWAPLVKSALQAVDELYVVYAEPSSYVYHASPASTALFDLSEGFRGLAPLPGFANLSGPPRDAEILFVPFLGFEGPRARYLAMSLEYPPKVIPVVGGPGYRAEYPQVTIASNQEFLSEFRAYSDVRYARASCPFEAYSTLMEIRRDNPGAYMYIAPIGTKPHALGALWFAIDHPADTEVMYDHPIKSLKRTQGLGRVHIYNLKSRDAHI